MMKNIADFRKLFEVYFTPLVKYAYSITKDKEQSKDIVQTFFVTCWHDKSIENIRNFDSFAFVAIRNRCYSWLKSQKRFLGEIPDDIQTDQTVHDQRFPIYLLESAIRNLPEKCREIFVLSKEEGLTYPEIADVLNLSIKTVERQMGIGFTKLRETLAPHKDQFMDY